MLEPHPIQSLSHFQSSPTREEQGGFDALTFYFPSATLPRSLDRPSTVEYYAIAIGRLDGFPGSF